VYAFGPSEEERAAGEESNFGTAEESSGLFWRRGWTLRTELRDAMVAFPPLLPFAAIGKSFHIAGVFHSEKSNGKQH
jgi:hypothetical protein